MSNLFRKPKTPDLPPEPEPIEEIQKVEEDAAIVGQKQKKKLLRGGRRGTLISGIQAALKQRLGR